MSRQSQKSNGRSRFSNHWRPGGDIRATCEHCPWLRIEQFSKPINRLARQHVEETGHTVELRRESYTLVTPEADRVA